MLEAMLEGWRGKRVLIVGKPDGLCAFLTAMLEEIGARLMRVGDRADAQALCRALTAGRIGAVILPEEMTGRDLPERLVATLTLIQEIREAGVPLLFWRERRLSAGGRARDWKLLFCKWQFWARRAD